MRRRLGVVAIALAVVACGGGGASGGGANPPSGDSPDVAEPGSYETLRELQLDVESAFILCNAPMKVYDPPEREGALEHADCVNAVNLFLYDPNEVAAYAATIQSEPEPPVGVLYGTNWIVTCYRAGDCEKIQGITGGELLLS